MIRERAAGPIEDVEYRGARRRRRRRRRSRRSPRRERDRHRPVEPGDLDRPDPRGAGHRATRCARRRRRSSPSRRSCAARCSRARPPTSWRWAGQPLDSDGIADHYAGLIDGLVADERAERRADARDRRRDGRRRRRAGAWRARCSAFAAALRGKRRADADRRDPARQVVRPRQAAARHGACADRPALAAAMVADVLDALARGRRARRRDRRHRRGPRAAAARARRGARRRTTRTRPASPPPPRAASRPRVERGAERALLVPGDCPALDPARGRPRCSRAAGPAW